MRLFAFLLPWHEYEVKLVDLSSSEFTHLDFYRNFGEVTR